MMVMDDVNKETEPQNDRNNVIDIDEMDIKGI